MEAPAISDEPPRPASGRLARNVMHFARALRAAGLPVGPGRVIKALRAVETVGVERRSDLYWTLHAVFVNRRDQRELFDQCFHVFWRDPKILERITQLLLPQLEAETPSGQEEVNRRVADAFAPEKLPGRGEGQEEDEEVEVELDASLTFSARELLQGKDFEQMTAGELDEAKREIARLRLPIMQVRTRRFTPEPHGSRIDMRRTLRSMLRSGGGSIEIRRKSPVRRHPPLVILCDISGSMSRYSRMLLLFMHAITGDRDRVHSFLFGTRLTNVTRYLRSRDVDLALDRIGEAVQDWSGGTRIGHCIAEFNRVWSRRVLGQGAVVLLISDGLDRDAGHGLPQEMERLHKSCRRLMWLNPLLRYDAYAPISSGARAMIRHVDEFRSVHNLNSLRELTEVLSHEGVRRAEGLSEWVAASKGAEA
ncbi:vWA domain-containing protein [Marinimicrococcus flavescens]|uniref:VWA domain-containing protein n=1 Tax=Marinimicrococcus flavescens TaxID=3031815 RepID=A0AAP3UZP5_9PROT|nr:VWA domain-containing protein [Marinimicrococcus flavescens]